MKKIILSLLAIASLSGLFAQSLELTTDAPIPAMNLVDLGTTKDFEGFHIKNITTHAMNVRINRMVNDIPAGHETYFCWEACYGPTTNLSPAAGLAIQAGATANNFTFHINANGIEGCGHIVVQIFNAADQNDYVEQIIDYCTPNAVSIANEINPKTVLSAPMPNPSSDVATVKIDLPRNTENTYLAIRDLTGKEISRIAVNTPSTSISIPTSQFNTGLYYLSLVAEGNVLATQKLVVSR